MENDFNFSFGLLSKVSKATSYIRDLWEDPNPLISVICGSGWGEIVHEFSTSQSISYQDIPGFSKTTVTGHAGRLHLCKLNGLDLLIFQGRRHYYEGEGWQPVVFPVLLARELGTKTILLTNAAGGINTDFQVGDFMVLRDHLNFMPGNPLIGKPLYPEFQRFPDQSEIYDPTLRKLLIQAAEKNQAPIHQGVYLALSGPAFETPAEISAFSKLGADAVGMSTVPEAMIGNALGMKIAALSCISNLAAGISKEPLSHEDVENTSFAFLPNMKATILSFLHAFTE